MAINTYSVTLNYDHHHISADFTWPRNKRIPLALVGIQIYLKRIMNIPTHDQHHPQTCPATNRIIAAGDQFAFYQSGCAFKVKTLNSLRFDSTAVHRIAAL